MTRRLRDFSAPHLWLADSEFNRGDLIADGVAADRITVSSPFNRTEQLLPIVHTAGYDGKLSLLFVGRLAPNKGHLHLLRLVRALVYEEGRDVVLRIVGAIDPELKSYHDDIAATAAALQIESHVEMRSHCSDAEVAELFQHSNFFPCFSEHEGFCVPVIEAQAIGLPTIGAAVTAVGETAGPEQFFDRLPEAETDYSFYAALLNHLAEDAALRAETLQRAERNVRERFTGEPVENAFTGALYEALNLA